MTALWPCFASLAGALAAPPAEITREIRVSMGTLAEVRVEGASRPHEVLGTAFARVDETEAALSIWVENSEIARLNQGREAILTELAYTAVQRAVEIARASGGAFDPTLTEGGFESVRLDDATRRVVLKNGVTLDLGGLAKGLAVDRALAELESRATSGLVDIGTSSLAVFGSEPVTFEVRDPEGGGTPPATFRLRRGAVGSSSREQWGDHIKRTRSVTGTPAMAVTVVSDSALEADALSTAVFVLGAERGLTLVTQRGSEAVVLVVEEGRRTLWASPGFAENYALEVAEGVAIRVFPVSGSLSSKAVFWRRP